MQVLGSRNNLSLVEKLASGENTWMQLTLFQDYGLGQALLVRDSGVLKLSLT
ncbi:hypothetical protein I79_025215 [Cricetulus griseus]|uniref:Uncharacterized protein n=1 Tax=Cricetulus griseus TaxID=10029 RepID=G3IMS0_CRIGR|nr:hypothetical protein I79_025215 [Cricetulus griseus]